MASAEQIKALLKSHIDGEDDRFFSVAMQVAAHEARLGHGKLAAELRSMIDDAKGKLDHFKRLIRAYLAETRDKAGRRRDSRVSEADQFGSARRGRRHSTPHRR